jgi:hypothetical protein
MEAEALFAFSRGHLTRVWGKQVLTFDMPENTHVVTSGVTPIQPTKLMNQFTQHQPQRV